MRVPYTREHQSRVVMLGKDGENITAIAQSLISAVGDTASAYLTAKQREDTAQTPDEAAKWREIAAIIQANNKEQPNYTPWLIGGGIALVGLVLLSNRRR